MRAPHAPTAHHPPPTPPWHRKLRDAQESLQGDQGRERLVGLHRELVARRCLMVVQLGRIFRLGPITGVPQGLLGWCMVYGWGGVFGCVVRVCYSSTLW